MLEEEDTPMKQITLPVFAIATLIAGPLMAQSVVQQGVVGDHGSSASIAQGGSPGCMEKMSDSAQTLESRMASIQAKRIKGLCGA
jgi:hypothetical protein